MKATRTLLLTAFAVTAPVVAFAQPLWTLSAPAAQDPVPQVPTIDEANALVQAGNFQAAEAAFSKIADAEPQNGRAVFMHAYCLHMNGKLDAAHDRHIDAANFPDFAPIAHYNHACVHSLRGEKDLAFAALQEARAAGFDNVQQLETDTDMDNVRGDARFAAFLLEIGGNTFEGVPITQVAKLPAARRFDFTIGDWNTFRGEEAMGTTSITRAFEGKGVQTTSRSAEDGSTRSTSTFVYDEENKVWKQIWVGRDGTTALLTGGLDGDKLVLTMSSLNGEPKVEGRTLYSNITADGFQLTWQTTQDGGKTWTEDAKLRYERR